MYKIVSPSSEPSVIGVNNGVYQVELDEKKSFLNRDEKKYYESYFNGNFNSFILENFKTIDNNKITELLYFPLKKAKETDFVRFSPNEMGLNFLISQNVADIFEKFSITNYVKIPTKVSGFSKSYYAVGFPIVTEKSIDFYNSKFYHIIKKNLFTNLSFEDYKKISGTLVKASEIKLVENRSLSDIVNLQGQGLFFSDALISELNNNDIIGIEVGNTILKTH